MPVITLLCVLVNNPSHVHSLNWHRPALIGTGQLCELAIRCVLEFDANCSVGVINPMTNMPGADLIDTFKRLQPGCKTANPEYSGYGEPDDARHAVTIAGGLSGP